MKNKAKGVFAAFLAAVLSVSAGCASGGVQLSEDRLGKINPVTAANAGDQTGVRVNYTTDEPEIEQKTVVTPAAAEEQNAVKTATPSETGSADQLLEQGGQAEQDTAAVHTANVPVVGKSYQELYPDLKADGTIISDKAADEENLIKTQDDYFEAAYPSNGQKTYRSIVLPASVDNSDSEYFPEIDSQGGLGSCVCWATVYYQFTYTHNRSRQITTTRATTFSPKFIYNMLNGAENQGTQAESAYLRLMRHGCVLWNQLPYSDQDYKSLPTDAELYRYGLEHQLKSYQRFEEIGETDSLITSPTDTDLDAIKTALANHEVLTYSTNFSSWRADRLKASGNPDINKGVVGQEVVVSCDSSEGGHEMTLVGYNDNIWTDLNGNNQIDAGEMGAFKVANSHGKDYANQGFAWVAYDALNVKTCVEGAYNAENRKKAFNFIYRVEVQPEDYSPNYRAEYTINTDDRSHTGLKLKAEWANTVVEYNVDINGGAGISGYLSYAGTKTATDASAVIDLKRFMDALKASNMEEVKWTLTPYSDGEKGHAMILKAFKVYDTRTGTSYSLNQLPVTVNQNSQSLVVHESVNNNAVVYYRGYKDAVIQYALGIATPTKSEKMWFNDQEKHGYVYKYVIPLGSNHSATIKIGDGNGKWDDNGGQYFVVEKGDNFIVTSNVGDPLKLEITPNLPEVADLGCCISDTILVSGGYTPYEYRIEVKDTGSKQIEYETEYKDFHYSKVNDKGEVEFQMNQYKPQKETVYQNTVYIRDSAGTEVKKTYILTIKDEPFTVADFSIQDPKSEYPCQQQMSFYVEMINDSVNGGSCNGTFAVMKDGKICYKKVERMGYLPPIKKTRYAFKWTPTEGGTYTAMVGRTNLDGEYTFKTLQFKVADNHLKLSSVSVTPQDALCMGDVIQVSAQASGGDGTYQYRYAVNRCGDEASAVDYSSKTSAAVQLPCETGSCDVVVTVKDGSGQTATYYKTLNVSLQPRIKSLSADKAAIETGDTVTITPETKNVAAGLAASNYVYTATINGQTTTLTTNANKTASWKPTVAGTYTVKLALKNGENTLAAGSKTFTVAQSTKPQAYTVRVGVVYYLNDANNASQFKVHYWNNSGVAADAACVKTTATANVSVGSEFWGGAAQKFYIYEATIPMTATGYKFHIGDKWFGDNGSLSTSNTVYVFEYSDVYRASYRKE